MHSLGQECAYQTYFQITDQAKEQVRKQNFQAAQSNFEKAFKLVEFPLGHDLSYALFLAEQTKDHAWARLMAVRLAKGGVPLRYFSKYKRQNWYKGFAENFNAYTAYYEQHFKRNMKAAFLELYEKDMAFNEMYHSWREGKIALEVEELIEGAREIASGYAEFTAQYGLPLEQNMGYHYNRGKNQVEKFPAAVLLIHLRQLGDTISEDHIRTLVCKGGLNPKYEATLNGITGFGNGTGIAQEMRARYAKYRPGN